MDQLARFLKCIVTAFLATVVLSLPLGAQEDREAQLLTKLKEPDLEASEWEAVEAELMTVWSRSGSASMDLLLRRGRDALEAENTAAAIDHFSALVEQAPDFAEGWNARATAFFHADEYGLSLSDIERTLELNPNHFGALTGLALILQELGYYEDALKAYKAVQDIHPHRPNVNEAVDRLEEDLSGSDL